MFWSSIILSVMIVSSSLERCWANYDKMFWSSIILSVMIVSSSLERCWANYEADLSLYAINYTDAKPIIRDQVGPYNFTLEAILTNKSQIAKNVEVNFSISYFITEKYPPAECKETLEGEEYIGYKSITTDGQECDYWDRYLDDQQILRFVQATKPENFCRNPDKSNVGPWCFVNATKIPCGIPFCNTSETCRNYERGSGYIGKQNQTISGLVCQRWDQQTPHTHVFTFLSSEENYCRSPAKLPGGPWCYTTDPNKLFEECGIPFCYPDAEIYLRKSFVNKVQNTMPTTLKAGNIGHKLAVQVPLFIDTKTCLAVNYICFIVNGNNSQLQVEKDFNNNMVCKDLKTIKNCQPNIEVRPTGIQFLQSVVRGYSTKVNVNVKIKNMDTWMPIPQVTDNSMNFKVNVFMTNYDMKTIGDPHTSFKFSSPLNANASQLQQRLNPENEISIVGEVSFVVDRSMCPLISQICTEVVPGLDSSYRIFPGTKHLSCFSVNKAYTNCEGLNIHNVQFQSMEKYWKAGSMAYFNVSWEVGTDVYFSIDYGDNTPLYTWNWKMDDKTRMTKLSSYTIVSHIFAEMGQYNIQLNMWNNLNTISINATTSIQPDFVTAKEPYIKMEVSFEPSVKPVPVKIKLSHARENLSVPIDVKCNVSWGDGLVSTEKEFSLTDVNSGIVNHAYQSQLSEVVVNITCQNHVSSISDSYVLIFRNPITGLKIVSQRDAFSTNVPALFNVTMETGTHVTLLVDFGDGITENFTNADVFTSTYIWVIEHVYKIAGNFSVLLEATNGHFESNTTINNAVIIQNPVSNMNITGPDFVKYPTGEAVFTVTKSRKSDINNGVSCRLFVNGILTSHTDTYVGDFASPSTFKFSFVRNSIFSHSNVSVNCYNLISNNSASFQTKVVEMISGVGSPKVLFAIANSSLSFSVSTQTGSEVSFSIHFGDNLTSNINYTNIDSAGKSIMLDHRYEKIGNYSIYILAKNMVSQENTTTKIVVYNTINNISLLGSGKTIWPPALAKLTLLTDQKPLFNLHCYFSYGKGPEYVYVDRLSSGLSFSHFIYFPESAVGRGDVNVSCTNQISSLDTGTKMEVIMDAVTVIYLETKAPVWWTNQSILILHIKRLASFSCFLWDLGDGTFHLYGVEWCDKNATDKMLNITRINFGINSIEHRHVYKTWGVYNVTVKAFNHVSQDIVSNITVVKDWYCKKPKVKFPDQFTNKTNITQIMRGFSYTINPEMVFVDCMKSFNKTKKILTIVNFETNKIALVLKNVSFFQYEPRMLPFGKYYGDYTLVMSGLLLNATARFYFEIIASPLVANLAGNKHETTNFNDAIVMNAFDFTVDPDSDPNSVNDIEFSWFCKQINEKYPKDSNGNILPAGPANMSAKNPDDFKGCFGGGPGKLPETSGKFVLDTGMMIPNKTFELTLVATRNGKSAKTSKIITLESPAAPKITITCQENCQHKKRISGSLILSTNCTDSCNTKYGNLQYHWSMTWKDKISGNVTQYKDLADITATGINSAKLNIKPHSLVGGVWHNITLMAYTPFSIRTILTFSFLSNLPPFGGRCWVEPTNGFVMKTLFQFKCAGWKEWLVNSDRGLKYEFRVRSFGKKRSYLVYYGNETSSDKMYLPLGNYKVQYINHVILFIVDQVGDYYEIIQNVTVQPPVIPKMVLLNEILRQLNDSSSDIGRAIVAKQYQVASSSIYSMLSLVNLPTDVQTVNETEDDIELFKLKKIVRTAVVNTISSFPVKSMDGLDQTNELLMGSVESPEEVEIGALDKASGKLGGLSDFFVQNRNTSSPEKKKQLVTDMTFTTLGMIISSDSALKSSSKNNDTSVQQDLNTTNVSMINSTSVRKMSNSSVRYQVAGIMKKSVAIIDDLSGAQLNDMEIGAPPDVISIDKLTLRMEKQEGSKLTDSKFNTDEGGVEMSDLSPELVKSKCVKKSTVISGINPYIWDDSAESVKSSVLKFGVSACDDEIPSKKETDYYMTIEIGVTRLLCSEVNAVSSNFNVELPILSPENPLSVESNTTGEDTMIYHYLALTSTNMPVLVSVYPDNNDTFEVLISLNEFPTEENLYQSVKVPIEDTAINETSKDYYELCHSVFISPENLTLANANKVYIGIRRFDCKKRGVCQIPLKYKYKLSQPQCQIWDTDIEAWVSDGCEVQPGSTPTKIKFKSNLFGSLGAGMFVGPNTIDFSAVFQNPGKKIVENAAVFFTVIAVLILYVPLAIICRRYDKKDRRKWMVLPLCDNNSEHEFGYELHVYTGMKTGSGTASKIHFVLAGTDSDSGVRYLHDGERKNFETGDVNSFIMRTDTCLGIPCTIKIWHDNSGVGKAADWYLSKIVVVDLQTQKWYLFLCDRWLSEERGDGRTECVTHISKKEDESAPALMENNVKRQLFDDHLWLSVGYRKTRSTFTRVQRLSCCFAILFLTMVTNAMWHGTGDSGKTQSAITIGPITLTVHQLYTSVMSSLIVVPPSVIISLLFAKRGARKRKNNKYKLKSATGKRKKQDIVATDKINETGIKKSRKLPYWIIIIAYLLVFLSVACGAFFTILYAFEWGKAKSEEWLTSFVMSFVQSVVVIQPLKVVIVAGLISFLFKKDSDVVDYEDKIGKMELGSKDIKPANKDVLKLTQELTEEEINLLEKNKTLNRKMNGLIREILYDVLFLLLLLWVVLGNQNPNVYLQNTDLRNCFTSGLSSIRTQNATWKWFRNVMLPCLYLTHDYNSNPVTSYDTKFIGSGYSMRFGPPRLRQVRVNKDMCLRAPSVYGLIHRCSQSVRENNEDDLNYDPSWIIKDNATVPFDKLDPIEQAFIYKTEDELQGSPYWGLFQWYSGSGYVANLGRTKPEAETIMQQLENNTWIDRYTRVIFLEFNVWNANSNLFNMFILTFEFTTDGNIGNWITADSINLYRYTGAGGLLNLLAEIILTIFIIIVTVLEIRKIVKTRGRYFKQFWNGVLFCCLLCYYAAMGVYAYRSVLTTSKIEEMMNNREKSINFQRLVEINTIFMCFMGLMSYMMELRLLNTLRYIKSTAIMMKTLAKSGSRIVGIGIGFSVIFAAYISVLFLSYCNKLYEYRSFQTTATYLTTVFFGTSMNFNKSLKATGYLGAVILMSYLMLMITFWLNVFVVVLDQTLHEVQEYDEFKSIEYEVVEHMVKMFSGMISPTSKKVKPKTGDSASITKSSELAKITDKDGKKTSIDIIFRAKDFEGKSGDNEKQTKEYKKKDIYKRDMITNENSHKSFDTVFPRNSALLPRISHDNCSGSSSDLNNEKYRKELIDDLDKLFSTDMLQTGSRRNSGIDSGISSVISSQKDLRSMDF